LRAFRARLLCFVRKYAVWERGSVMTGEERAGRPEAIESHRAEQTEGGRDGDPPVGSQMDGGETEQAASGGSPAAGETDAERGGALALARQEAAQAKAEATEAREQLAQSRARALRADLIAANAPGLPAAYRWQINGDDEGAIRESIDKARNQHRADVVSELRSVAGMAPEQIVEAFGEEALPLAERLAAGAPSVGAPARAPGQPAVALTEAPIDRMNGQQLRETLARQGVRVRL